MRITNARFVEPGRFMAVWLPLIFGTFKNPALQPERSTPSLKMNAFYAAFKSSLLLRVDK
jgi:hypothetical protein